MMKLWIYENHIWELRGQELYERTLDLLSQVYNEPIQRPAPSWLVSSIGKSAAPLSQRSRVWIPYKPEFFQAFFSQLQKLRL